MLIKGYSVLSSCKSDGSRLFITTTIAANNPCSAGLNYFFTPRKICPTAIDRPFSSSYHYVQQSYLPLLKGMSGQVSPAGSLEQRDVPPGLNIPLLLQPGQSSCSEEHLPEEKGALKQSHTLILFLKVGTHGHINTAENICQLWKNSS